MTALRAGVAHGLSANPGKQAAERFVLGYTPVWAALVGAAMISGAARKWGDGLLLILGVGLWAPLAIRPLIWPSLEERRTTWHRRYAVKIQAWMLVFAFLGNWFGTRYFYEVLDMHYGFNSTLNPNHVPLFLYFLTVTYFSTYSVVANIGRRFLVRWVPPWFAWALIAVTLAALETASNANPFMAGAFCYGRLGFALWFGTLLYGTWFLIAAPLWFPIDESPGIDTPWRTVLGSVLAAFMLILVAMELFEQAIAPLVTTVHLGTVGLRDFGQSCLGQKP